jgi:hypothetical protein
VAAVRRVALRSLLPSSRLVPTLALLAAVENDVNERQQGARVTTVPFGELIPGAVFLSDTVTTDDTGRYWLYVLVKSPPDVPGGYLWLFFFM